jgi:serine/threonine protein kinase
MSYFVIRVLYFRRDLKPENLLMVSDEDDCALKIVDFGFAARVNGMSLSKQCGTPGYVAPEILENRLHGMFTCLTHFIYLVLIFLSFGLPMLSMHAQYVPYIIFIFVPSSLIPQVPLWICGRSV